MGRLATWSITIPHRYCGPPESGNGGWVSGTVAEHVRDDRPSGPP